MVALIALAQGTAAQPAQPPSVPSAPPAPPPPAQGSQQEQRSDTAIVISQKHYIRQGHVEIHDAGQKTDIYADMVEFFEDEDRAVATGNVVVAQGANRISSERADFNTKTTLGTFFNASGIATVPPPKPQPPRPGAIALPPLVGQDTVVYFFGETVEKVAPRRYKITKGGFTTCVQPTPRWDMSASTVLLNLEHYTLLKNAVMTVKGVPMLYLPVMYYPTKKGDRATGFLIPTYGASTLRGQSIHNAFFWAIDRSQDATVGYDWFSKIGQGVGGEYRYNFGAGTDGNIRTYMLDQHASEYVDNNGQTQSIGASRSYEVHGGANQLLPGNLHARARVDYFSSIATEQTFNINIYDLSRNQRSYGGNLVGSWRTYSLNVTADHNEYYYDPQNSVVSGSWPRITFSRNERPLFGSDFYFSLSTEYSHPLSTRAGANDPVTGAATVDDQSLNRLDFAPQIRYPFKKWGWLTANSTVAWRDTFYSRILSPVDPAGVIPQVITNESFNRTFFNYQTQIVGPVFNRIWDTPNNGYAEKFKHSIEPSLTLQKTSDIDNINRLVYFDGTDAYVSGTQMTYAITNRFFAKRRLTPGQPGQAREIFSVDLRQSYYKNPLAASFDRQYQSTLIGGATPSNFSPIALTANAVPTTAFTGSLRAEIDSHYLKLRTISVNGTYSWTQQVQATLGWSKKALIPGLAGFDDPASLDHYINGSTTVRMRDNKYGTTYSFNYDILKSTMLQQSITGFYNAQCCGLAMQYQSYNSSYSQLPSDHRFFLSFTLAGLGNFSPFSGALSGVPR
jgi:LPS-assembly protein